MNKQDEQLASLSEIRSLMERSSRFISLSGLSGVVAGIFALLGAIAAFFYLGLDLNSGPYYEFPMARQAQNGSDNYFFFFITAGIVLAASLSCGVLLTIRKAKQKNQKIWDQTAKRLLINLAIPLMAGGLFCLALLNYGLIGLIAPCTLIFYGLSLLNASKYTLDDIRYLGISEIILGLVASYYIGYGLLFWSIGFGILHIIYGIVMYNKYEK